MSALGPASLLSDARFALRLIQKKPSFFGSLLLLLVLGLALTTTAFSVVNAVVVRVLPYSEPEQLTVVWATLPGEDRSKVSVPDFRDWQRGSHAFQQLVLVKEWGFSSVLPGHQPDFLMGVQVTSDFFEMLRVRPLQGRLLLPDDDRLEAEPVAVVSASLWRRRFGSDPHLIGKKIPLDTKDYRVVGIAPDGFSFGMPKLEAIDIWAPLSQAYPGFVSGIAVERDTHTCIAMGRRKPGVDMAQAQADLARVSAEIRAAHPDHQVGVHLTDLKDAVIGHNRLLIWLVFAGVCALFLLLCSNVASFLLTRTESRRAEFALRAALGASRARLKQQIFVETVVLFTIAGALAAVLSFWLTRAVCVLVAQLPAEWANWAGVPLDATGVLFCFGCSVLTGLLFGLIPSVAVSPNNLHEELKKSASRTLARRSQRALRSGLVVAQIALAFGLLVTANSVQRAAERLRHVPLGFDERNLAMVRVQALDNRFPSVEQRRALFEEVERRIRAQPGVESVSANSTLPLTWDFLIHFEIEGRPRAALTPEWRISRNTITPGYFRTLRIPLIEGREFERRDDRQAPGVVIISRKAAERYFPRQNPLGQRLAFEVDEPRGFRTIVGVVDDVRQYGPSLASVPEAYIPLAQDPADGLTFVARASQPDRLLADMPRLIASIDPRLAVSLCHRFEYWVRGWIGGPLLAAWLLNCFGWAALLVAALGVYGLISYVASDRSRDLGIRRALGAPVWNLLWLVTRAVIVPFATGLAFGWTLAWLGARVLLQSFPEARAFDSSSSLVQAAVLSLAAVLASAIPLWRAARISPRMALMYE